MQLNIGKRLFFGFFALLFLELALVGFGMFNIYRLSRLNRHSVELIEPLEVTHSLLLNFQKLMIPTSDYLTSGNIVEMEIFKLQEKEVKKCLAKAGGIFPADATPQFIQVAEEYFQRIHKMADDVFRIEKPIGSIEGAMLLAEMKAFMDKATEGLEQYAKYLDKWLADLKEENFKIMNESNVLFLSFSFLGLILSFLLSYLLARRIRKPIIYLENACKKLAIGQIDSRIEINTHDEFEELAGVFNQMALNLRESEDKLREYAVDLEKKVNERTQELQLAYTELTKAQDQLIQAEKLNAIGQLASGVAHEVKNPLAIIIQAVNYLEDKISKEQSDAYEVLGMIKESVRKANYIVHSLLDFSRATTLALEPYDINYILENSLNLVKQTLKFEHVEVIKEVNKDIPQVLIDKNRMEEVFINILLNAIHAIPQRGKIFIRSYTTQLEEIKKGIDKREEDYFKVGEKAVIVEIEDTGVGISEENLKRAFDPFFTTKEPGKGTGLGLAVTRNIITLHKGLIEIKSQVGKGTKVTITLKLA